jgi:hypothetical protein
VPVLSVEVGSSVGAVGMVLGSKGAGEVVGYMPDSRNACGGGPGSRYGWLGPGGGYLESLSSFPIPVPSSIPVPLFLVVVVTSPVVLVWWRGRWWYLVGSSNVGLSVAFTPFGSLLFLSPGFLGALAAFDDLVNLTDDVLSVWQEISIFVDRRIPRRHLRPIDVGDIWERDETFAVRSIDLFYRPVPLELCLATFGTFNDLGGLVGIRMHVRPGITHKRRRTWLVSVGKSGRFWNISGKVCDERNKRVINNPFTREAAADTEYKGE